LSSSRIAGGQSQPTVDVLLFRTSYQNSSKSNSSKASTPFSSTLEDVEKAARSATPATSAATSAATRQNLVAPPSNSRAIVSPASIADVPQTQGSAQSETAVPQDNTGPATMSPAGPPTMYSPSQSPSTNPSVYGGTAGQSYIEQLNLSGYEQQANDQNNRLYQNYLVEFQNWQMNGSQGAPPQPPQYEAINQSEFGSWWSQYQANIASGNGAAPNVSMFLANAPGSSS